MTQEEYETLNIKLVGKVINSVRSEFGECYIEFDDGTKISIFLYPGQDGLSIDIEYEDYGIEEDKP